MSSEVECVFLATKKQFTKAVESWKQTQSKHLSVFGHGFRQVIILKKQDAAAEYLELYNVKLG